MNLLINKKALITTALTALTVGLIALDASAAGHVNDKAKESKKPLLKKKVVTTNVNAAPITAVSATEKASVSVTQIKPTTAAAKKATKFSISDASFLFGPSLNDPANDVTASDSIGGLDAIYSRHFPSIGYKLTDSIKLSAVGDFTIKHTRPVTDPSARGMTVNDPYLKLAIADMLSFDIAKKEVSIEGQMRYYAPVSDASQAIKKRGAIRAEINPSVQLNKRLNFSMENYAQMDLNSVKANPTTGATLREYKLYTGPVLTYDISKKVSAFMLYEAAVAFDTKGQPTTKTAPGLSQADLEPGMNLTLSKAVTLSPYLNWYTAQPIKTTSVNLLAIFNIL